MPTDGVYGTMGRPAYVRLSQFSLTNSTTESKLTAYTLPPNPGKGTVITGEFMASLSTHTTAGNLTIAGYIGSTAVITTGAVAMVNSLTTDYMVGKFRAVIRSATTALCSLDIRSCAETAGVNNFIKGALDATADTVDWTAANDFTLGFTMSAASANNILLVEHFMVWVE